jgi:hypothetical protein
LITFNGFGDFSMTPQISLIRKISLSIIPSVQ